MFPADVLFYLLARQTVPILAGHGHGEYRGNELNCTVCGIMRPYWDKTRENIAHLPEGVPEGKDGGNSRGQRATFDRISQVEP